MNMRHSEIKSNTCNRYGFTRAPLRSGRWLTHVEQGTAEWENTMPLSSISATMWW